MAASTAGMVARQRFGAALKQARLQAPTPIKQIEAARKIGRKTVDRVSRFERGEAWPEPKELKALCALYGADDATRARLEMMLTEGRAIAHAWWAEFEGEFPESLTEFIAYEDSASAITTCVSNVVPGILQSEDYGRALTSYNARSTMAPNLVERSVQLRRLRRGVFDKPNPLTVEAIVGEAAIRQRIGGSEVMLRQLDALVEDVTQRDVTVRVIPFEAQSTLTYTFHILDFDGAGDRPIAAFDAMTGMSFKKDKKEVLGLKEFVKSLRELALSPEDSLTRIKSARKDFA
ncbi:helix-turn-helix transcriptional regulator [Streptomyces sp. NPDC004610]|uniref:helix-turn-helix domain-containing protein n=1 Tax=unclassified Streptomyces TaxID=2593676 RepID=UPI0033B9D5E4